MLYVPAHGTIQTYNHAEDSIYNRKATHPYTHELILSFLAS